MSIRRWKFPPLAVAAATAGLAWLGGCGKQLPSDCVYVTGGAGGVAGNMEGGAGTSGGGGIAGTDASAGTGGVAGTGGGAAGADAGGAGGASCVDAGPDDPATGCGASDCKPCDSTHGTPGCSNGQCTITCDSGYADCDGDASNGCEADLSSDATCGGCNTACAPAESCVSGQCQAVCGDGKFGAGEQCDDGNTNNLDGCDSSCNYETVMRMTALDIKPAAAPSFCTPATNVFGQVFPGSVLDLVNSDFQTSLDQGTLNLMLDFYGLKDLTGQNEPSFSLGILSGSLDPKHTGTWSAGAIDWWFLANSNTIDAQGVPTELLSGASIASGAFSVDANQLSMPFGGATIDLLEAHMRAGIDSVPPPNVPLPPPSALASGLAVFRSMTGTGANQGLCGNATVQSLAQIPLPKDFTASGLAGCVDPSAFSGCTAQPTITSHAYVWCGEHCGNPGDPDYDANGCSSCSADHCHSNPVGSGCNSMLDAIVGGCVVNPPDCIEAIVPTQPDVGTGGNPPGSLSLGANNKVTPATGTDAYSAYFTFTANRAHVTNNLP